MTPELPPEERKRHRALFFKLQLTRTQDDIRQILGAHVVRLGRLWR